jgi:hypothetical protein
MHHDEEHTGAEIVLEDLRQKCIYLNAKFDGNETIWWEYVKMHDNLCWNANHEVCSRMIHDTQGMSWT